MPASDRARTARTLLNVETLEGRVVPAAVRPPIVANTALMASLSPGTSLASAPVVTRVFVNGEVVMRVSGRVAFTGIGPALSTDAGGNPVETGGTTLFANGRSVGTFEAVRSVTKTVEFRINKHGHVARIVTFRIDAIPYVAPPETGVAWAHAVGGPRVG
jgi:hypothetical protein